MNILRKFLPQFLKLLIAGSIVAILIWKNSDGLIAAFRAIHPIWLAGAFLLYAIHIYANAWRWHLLLKAQKIDCSLMDAVSLTMQSFFFSLVIPGGAIGGDLVRVGFLTAKVPKEQKFDGAFTILMDRFTGMIGIFLVALIMLPFCLRYMNAEDKLMTALIWLLIAGSAAGLAAAAVVFQHRKLEKLKIYRKMQALADRFSGGLFSRVADALDSYEHCRREIIICIIASMIFVNGILGIAGFFIARGVDHSWTKAGATIEAVTLGNIAGLLPLTPSGVGARDFFVKNMLESAGMGKEQALASALSLTMIIIAFNLLGGFFFIGSSHKRKDPAKEADVRDR